MFTKSDGYRRASNWISFTMSVSSEKRDSVNRIFTGSSAHLHLEYSANDKVKCFAAVPALPLVLPDV